MKSILLLLLMSVMTSCAMLNTPNTCLIDAVAFQAKKEVESSGVWSRILIVNYSGQNGYAAHAWCIYEYPVNSGHGWAYDARGSKFIWIERDVRDCDANDLAKNIYPDFISAYFADKPDKEQFVGEVR